MRYLTLTHSGNTR